MTQHTITDVQEADRLWDEHPLPVVSEKTGIPRPTLQNWSQRGWISTETNHVGKDKKYDEETIRRADRLYNRMPIPDISDLLGIPVNTLRDWSRRGWINTTVNWGARQQTKDMPEKCARAAHLVYDRDLLQKQAAERMGVSESAISRYLKLYRNGKYP